ncbi:MAG: G8 domain [Phormidesmis priestleyi Ana]|uniref:G8 domain n=1 Tax=Phormidesmis priestleyi Ana TaxID=1666911 RepID=A0A0P8BVU9_9CYAN|nr:MAG: G8 domain [Phormidesmis priestleyi Ana]
MIDHLMDPILEDVLSENIVADVMLSTSETAHEGDHTSTELMQPIDNLIEDTASLPVSIIASDLVVDLVVTSATSLTHSHTASQPNTSGTLSASNLAFGTFISLLRNPIKAYSNSTDYTSSDISERSATAKAVLQALFEMYNMSPYESTTSSMSGEMDSGSEEMDSGSMTMHHHHLVDMLLLSGEETVTAINDGSWFDPNTWNSGEVPSYGAKVLIPSGITVLYDQESTARIDIIKVDGNLIFAHDQSTKLIVDTLFSTTIGTVYIGTEENPVQADKTTQIIIDSLSAVDDPMQLGKGVILSGKTRVYGAEKLDFVSLQNAHAGDNMLTLDLPLGDTVPTGWQVGDQLVLGGTAYNAAGSDADNTRFQDEVLTITAINGNQISFINSNITEGDNTILRFDHVRPVGFEDQVNLYVANTTRNVSIQTENGKDVPLENRGHVMFMHNNDVQVKNAGFYELGRSDKNKIVDEVVTNRDGSEGMGTNVRGRYAMHFHRAGAEDINSTPAIASGNAVVGSPGWGIVHHDSHAILENNVVFDVLGAGIVAESGNEIGRWSNNITIKTTGDDDPSEGFDHTKARVKNFDMGFNGEGYWLQGAGQVLMTDNIAVSAAGAGLGIFGGADGGVSARDKQVIQVSNLPAAWQDIAKGRGDESVVDASSVPLLGVSGFEVYNSGKGILTWGSMLNSDGQLSLDVPGSNTVVTAVPAHSYRSSIDDFQLWNIRNNGVQLWYTSQYDLSNGLILADTTIHPNGRGAGIANNGKNHTFTNLHIEDFAFGIQLPNDYGGNVGGAFHRDIIGSVIKDSYISGVRSNFIFFDNDNHYLQLEGNTFGTVVNNNASPTGSFNVAAIGGLAYHFDASASNDVDPWSAHSKYETSGIIAYGWDFNNDSVIDAFGRQVNHYFTATGMQSVSLTVWDQMGQATTLFQTVDVQQTAYGNAFLNGDFSQNSFLGSNSGSSVYAGAGWGRGGAAYVDTSGVLVLSDGNDWSASIGQVVQDNYLRRGQQLLKLDLKNINGASEYYKRNQISLSLWGVSGQFENTLSVNGPQQSGALAMDADQLLNVSLGDIDSNDWQALSWDLDFGLGYQYLLVEIHMQKGNDAGDYVAVDNFSLTGDGAIVLGASSMAMGMSGVASVEPIDSQPAIYPASHNMEDMLHTVHF